MLANVVTSTDFDTKPYQLQGLGEVGASFDDFVTFNQNEILLQLFGQTLYDAFSAGVAALPAVWSIEPQYAVDDLVVYGNNIYKSLVANNQNIVPTSDPLSWQKQADNRWLKLLAGDGYTISSRKYHYEGVKTFMLPYIYAMWLNKESTTTVSTGGVVSANSENSNAVTVSIKVMEKWIIFKRLVMNGYTTLRLFFYYTACRFHAQGTLFGYLFANDAVYYDDVKAEGDSSTVAYLNAHFTPLGSLNDFDL